MVKNDHAGFREIEHTADWELEVWGPDIPALLEQAARGMYALSGVQLKPEPRISRDFQLAMFDEESLLVDFLNELLWMLEEEALAFDQLQLRLEERQLKASLQGAPIASLNKEIKAVTFHNLQVNRRKSDLVVHIVFDV